jgi:hypothetical protein
VSVAGIGVGVDGGPVGVGLAGRAVGEEVAAGVGVNLRVEVAAVELAASVAGSCGVCGVASGARPQDASSSAIRQAASQRANPRRV